MIRTFVAVEIPEEIRQRANALVERLRVAQAKIRWAEIGTLHWTMSFLGDVPDTEIPAVCAQAAAAARVAGEATSPVPAGVGPEAPAPAASAEENPELAAYNARLAELAAQGPKTWRHRESVVVRRGP